MKRVLVVLVLIITTPSFSAERSTAEEQQLNELMGRMTEAQSRGDTAAVARYEAQIRALLPEVERQQQSRTVTPVGATNPQQQLIELQQQMQQRANSPDIKIAYAARKGDLDNVKHWFSKGANINAPRLDPGPPLMEAAIHGHLAVAAFLLENGAQLRLQSGMTTLDALRLAAEAKEDNSEMLRLLAKFGALELGNIENIGSLALKAEEEKGRHHKGISSTQITSGNALTAAVSKLRVKHVTTLLSLKVSANSWANGKSALMLAAERLNEVMVIALLDAGASVNDRAQNNKTALRLVLDKRETDKNRVARQAIIQLLRSKGGEE